MSVMTASASSPTNTHLGTRKSSGIMALDDASDDSSSNSSSDLQYLTKQENPTFSQSRVQSRHKKRTTSQDQQELDTTSNSEHSSRSSCSQRSSQSRRTKKKTSSQKGDSMRGPKKTSTSKRSSSKIYKDNADLLDGSTHSMLSTSSSMSKRRSSKSKKKENTHKPSTKKADQNIASSSLRGTRTIPVSRVSTANSRASFACDERDHHTSDRFSKALEIGADMSDSDEEELWLTSKSKQQSTQTTRAKNAPSIPHQVRPPSSTQDPNHDSLSSYGDDESKHAYPNEEQNFHDSVLSTASMFSGASAESNFSHVREKRAKSTTVTGHQEPKQMTEHDVGNLFSMALPLMADDEDEEDHVPIHDMSSAANLDMTENEIVDVEDLPVQPPPPVDDHEFEDTEVNLLVEASQHSDHSHLGPPLPDPSQVSPHDTDANLGSPQPDYSQASRHPDDTEADVTSPLPDHSEDMAGSVEHSHSEYSEVDVDCDEASYSSQDDDDDGDHPEPSISHSHPGLDDSENHDGNNGFMESSQAMAAPEPECQKTPAAPGLGGYPEKTTPEEEDAFDGHDPLKSSLKVATAVSKFKNALLLAKEAKTHAKKYRDEHDAKAGYIAHVDTTKKKDKNSEEEKEASSHSKAGSDNPLTETKESSSHSASDHSKLDPKSALAKFHVAPAESTAAPETSKESSSESSSEHSKPDNKSSALAKFQKTKAAIASASEAKNKLSKDGSIHAPTHVANKLDAAAEDAECEQSNAESLEPQLQKMRSVAKRSTQKPPIASKPPESGEGKRRMVQRSRTEDNTGAPRSRKPGEGRRLPPRTNTDDGILRTRTAPARSASDDSAVLVSRSGDPSLAKRRGAPRRTKSLRNAATSVNSDAKKAPLNGKLPRRSNTFDEMRIPRRKKPFKALSTESAPRRMKRPVKAQQDENQDGVDYLESGSGKSAIDSGTAQAFAANFLKIGASNPDATASTKKSISETGADDNAGHDASAGEDYLETDDLNPSIEHKSSEPSQSASEEPSASHAESGQPLNASPENKPEMSESERTDANDDESEFPESNDHAHPSFEAKDNELVDESDQEDPSESEYVEDEGDDSEGQDDEKDFPCPNPVSEEAHTALEETHSREYGREEAEHGKKKKKKKSKFGKIKVPWKSHGKHTTLEQSEVSLNTKGLLEELEKMNTQIQQDVAEHPVKPTIIEEDEEYHDDEDGDDIDDPEVLEALRKANEMMDMANKELLEATLSHPLPSGTDDLCDESTVGATNVKKLSKKELKEKEVTKRERELVDRVRQRRASGARQRNSIRGSAHPQRGSVRAQRDHAAPTRRPIRRTKSMGDDGVGDAIARRQMRGLAPAADDAPRSRRPGRRPSSTMQDDNHQHTGPPHPSSGRRPSRRAPMDAPEQQGPARRLRGDVNARNSDEDPAPRRSRPRRTVSTDGGMVQTTHGGAPSAARRGPRPTTARRMSSLG